MGRKRKEIPNVQINIKIPKPLNEELKEKGVDKSKLFRDAAYKILGKKEEL